MNALVLALLLALAPPSDAGGGARLHDLHVSYGAAVVEGGVLTVRIRFFRDDLEAALARHGRRPAYTLRPDPAVDGDFLAYFRTRFAVTAGGRSLEPVLVGSGEDELDREPVWWYALQFTSAEALGTFHVRNALLLELFDDQTNIVKFIHLPGERQKTFSFQEGADRFEVRFR